MSLPEAPPSIQRAAAGTHADPLGSKARDASRRSSLTSSPASLRSLRSVETNGLLETNLTSEPRPAIVDMHNLPPPAYSATAPPGSGPTMVMRDAEAGASHQYGYGALDMPPSEHALRPDMQQASGPSQQDVESAPLLVRRTPPKRPNCCEECCCCSCSTRCTIRWALAILLLVVVPCFVVARILSGKSSHSGGHGDTVVYPDPFEGFQPRPECAAPARFDNTTLLFQSLDKFTFREVMQGSKPARPKFRVSGRVLTQKARFDQDAAIVAFISTGAEDEETLKFVSYSKTKSSLEIDTSPFGDYSMLAKTSNPCVAINVVLSVKPGLTIDNLQLKTVNMKIELDEGLSMAVKNETTVGSFVGDISGAEASTFSSRRIIISSHSGDIKGSWPLQDVLSISSDAGDIDVKPSPKEASREQPLPAEFSTKSESGDVKVRFPQTGQLPNRDYRTSIGSVAGDIFGHLIHGTSTKVDTGAGDCVVDVLPYAADAYNSTLEVHSTAGDTKLVVHSPYADPGQPIRRLSGIHSTFSGDVSVTYPPEWEGSVSARSASGSVSLHGKGLVVQRKGRYEYAGTKGNGTSVSQLVSFSGDVNFFVRDKN